MRRPFSRPAWFAFALAAALSAAASACGAEANPGTVERILAGQLHLTRGLLEALAREHPGENVVVSPASAAGMLAAVDLGAGPAMHADILKVLGLLPGPATEGDLTALREAAARTRADGDLSTATRVVFDRALHPAAAGLDRLKAAGVEGEVTDLHAPSAVAVINAWAARATQGKIDGIIDAIAPDEEMIALNALYFSGRWLHPFEASETRPGDFVTAHGQRVRAPFMHGEPTSYAVRQDDRFVAIDLPFQGGRFAMVALTTRDAPGLASDLSGHLDWLDGRAFAPVSGVVVDLPHFSIKTEQALLTELRAIGLDDREPFSRFAKSALTLSAIDQAVNVTFNEKGAVVAAVTKGEFRVVSKFIPSRNMEIVFDKPFAYAVRDMRTGVILAAGYVSAVDGAPLAETAAPMTAGSPLTGGDTRLRAKDRTMERPAMPAPTQDALKARLRIERDF